jgi:hypothetical protein
VLEALTSLPDGARLYRFKVRINRVGYPSFFVNAGDAAVNGFLREIRRPGPFVSLVGPTLGCLRSYEDWQSRGGNQ